MRGALLIIAAVGIAGCAAPPPFERGMPQPSAPPVAAAPADAPGAAIARGAQSLIGAPYRYGGAGPDAFDCSGLVSYVHRQLGLLHAADGRAAVRGGGARAAGGPATG